MGFFRAESLLFATECGCKAQTRPLAEQLDQLVSTLQREGYARDSIRITIRAASKFSRWLETRKYTASDVTDVLVDRYLSGIQRYASGNQRKCAQGLVHMVRLLREQGVPAIAPDEQMQTNIDGWLKQYSQHLTDVAGLRESSCIVYRRNARYLLVALFPDDRINWKNVTAESLCSFVCHQADNRRGAGRKTPGTVVRSVIRFLEFSGELDAAIAGAIPTVRQSTHGALPRRLCTYDIERVLDAVQEYGLQEADRDYAILLMLSQLGLRSCEIANLRLEDVDWAEGQILIRPGKTHQERALPLTQEVGDAIAIYVQHTRARSASRKVFLKACPPFTPFTSAAAIGHIAKRAMHRAMLLTLYNSGARVTEIAKLERSQVHFGLETYLQLNGKGRKERTVPLWAETSTALKSWFSELADIESPAAFPSARLSKTRLQTPARRSLPWLTHPPPPDVAPPRWLASPALPAHRADPG